MPASNSEIVKETKRIGEKIDVIRATVDSSSIKVSVVIRVDQKTQRNFNGREMASIYECYLRTKSGHDLTFRSSPGQTKMVRSDYTYEFEFTANLSPQENIFREKAEEFFEAKSIRVPLNKFVSRIKGDLSPQVTCKLYYAKIEFWVNNTQLHCSHEDKDSEIDETKEITLSLRE